MDIPKHREFTFSGHGGQVVFHPRHNVDAPTDKLLNIPFQITHVDLKDRFQGNTVLVVESKFGLKSLNICVKTCHSINNQVAMVNVINASRGMKNCIE